MAGRDGFRVFISAVSNEFGDARSRVASDLRARGLEVKVQEDFRNEDAPTTLELLHDYIRDCDAVICIIGRRSGSSPPSAAAEPYALPDGIERASYTQWELRFARAFEKRLSLFEASDVYEPDRPAPGSDDPTLQRDFTDWLFRTLGLTRRRFDSPDGLRAEVLREDWPLIAAERPTVLPYQSLGDEFVGREPMLDRLHESLRAGQSATAVTSNVVHGLGGVGKSRLAVEYAWRHQADYAAVLFVLAESPAALGQELASLCGPLALNLPEQDATDQDAQVAAAIRWLSSNPGWLLILDNVDDDAAAKTVERLLPHLSSGRVLITSRRADWAGAVETLELDVLDLDEAARLILERTERRRVPGDTDDADALALATEVGGLALAVEQAAGYVRHRRCSLAAYLAEWRASEPAVRAWHDPKHVQYPRSVAVTWQTTIDQLSEFELGVLRTLSYVGPEPLPTWVLSEPDIGAWWPDGIDVGDDVDVFDALASLAGLSMLQWEAGTASVTVHRVVQQIMRDRAGADATWVGAAARLVDAALPPSPGDTRSWSRWDPIRPHVAEAARFADDLSIADPTATLMANLSTLLHVKALYDDAEPLMRRALTIDETSYGPDHPNVARDLNNLAQLLQDTNRLDDAEPLMRRALQIDETSYGPDHPESPSASTTSPNSSKTPTDSTTPNPSCAAHCRSTKPATAPTTPSRHRPQQPRPTAPDHEPTGRRRTPHAPRPHHRRNQLRPRPPRVAIDLNNLAQLLQITNRLDDAEPLMRRALTIDETSYGPDHPESPSASTTSPNSSKPPTDSTTPNPSCAGWW